MAEDKTSTTVPLNWSDVYFTNCPMVSANNVDQELGWCKMDFKISGSQRCGKILLYPHGLPNAQGGV